MSNKIQLTQEGYQQLADELNTLKEKQNRLITQIEEVAMPDESGQDGLAIQLKEELELVNDKIDKIEEALESAEIITEKMPKSNGVQVGNKVTITVSGNSKKEFHIVSHLESDPSANKISDQSPLGKALLGKRVGDKVDVEAPVGTISYKVVSIN